MTERCFLCGMNLPRRRQRAESSYSRLARHFATSHGWRSCLCGIGMSGAHIEELVRNSELQQHILFHRLGDR